MAPARFCEAIRQVFPLVRQVVPLVVDQVVPLVGHQARPRHRCSASAGSPTCCGVGAGGPATPLGQGEKLGDAGGGGGDRGNLYCLCTAGGHKYTQYENARHCLVIAFRPTHLDNQCIHHHSPRQLQQTPPPPQVLQKFPPPQRDILTCPDPSFPAPARRPPSLPEHQHLNPHMTLWKISTSSFNSLQGNHCDLKLTKSRPRKN